MNNDFILIKIIFIALLFLTISCSRNNEHTALNTLDVETLTLMQNAHHLEQLFVKADSVILTFPEEHTIAGLHYVHISEDSNIIVTDTRFARKVLQFNKRGEFLRQVGREGEGPGEYRRPLHVFTNKNYIVISDIGHYRISFFNRDGSFSHSFQVSLFFDGLFLAPDNRVIIQSQMPFKEEKTIHVYTANGKLLHKFGQSSEAFYRLMQHIPPYKSSNTLITSYQDAIYEMDFADFHIRKYSEQGDSKYVFGVKPEEYRSPLSTNYQALHQQMVTPDVLQQLKKFRSEEFSKCSAVSGIISLHPGIICTRIKNQHKSGFTKSEYFNFYDLAGNLIRNEIAFKDFIMFANSEQARLMMAPPHDLILVVFLDRQWGDPIRKLKLIWLNLKTSGETDENA